jgi:hypothetical protein
MSDITKPSSALAIASDRCEVAVDRAAEHVVPGSMAEAVRSFLADSAAALGDMKPDDISIEVVTHSDRDRSSSTFKYRAHKRQLP